MKEKDETLNDINEAQNKQQTLIDITPHQTLSIETTTATVEESKKEFDFKRYAEVANGRINEYGERDEDLCKEYEEICSSDGYKEWLKTLLPVQDIIEQQDKESKENYVMNNTNPLGLRSKTGTFTFGFGNDWQEEETCKAFHFFLKNINNPLTIRQIQANLFPRYNELVIIRLLDDLVERLEIEYTKEKIDNEDVYKIEPLEMFLWKTTDTHFLSKKLRREIIIEIVERVRLNVYDGHYQEAKKKIELDILVNFHNPIEEIKERIETVRNKLNRRITFYYKVDDIDKFVEMIQNRHLDKHFINDKTEDVEIIEWELNKMFKLQSWIDCGNNKLRELLTTNPTTSATVESKNLVLSHQTISIGIETASATVEESINLTHREIATLHYLNGLRDLTYPQAEELALFYGQKSRTSGKRLKEQYWKVIEKEEGMNDKYNAEIYTHSNSYQSILKIIPLLEKEECIKLANEYLKKSEPYKDVKSKEY